MKIVHAVRSDGFAGVERYIATVGAAQAASGCTVHVIGGDPRRMAQALTGTQVTWEPAVTTAQVGRSLFRTRGSLLVHAHMTAAESAAVVAAHAPVVTTRHFNGRRGSNMATRAAGRYVSRRIRGQVAISEYVARTVEGPTTVIHPGVPSVPDPIDDAVDRQPIVLMAQRLEVEKRTDVGLGIWAASGLAELGWRLVVAGSGVLRSDLEELARQLGVRGSCDFLGSREDVGDLMSSAAVFLAPRPDEPFGLSVVEAMAHGTPVVAAAGGGHNETVGACHGAVLVRANDLQHAGAQLRALAEDGARRVAYGRELRDLQLRSFSLAGHVDRLRLFYEDVLA